MTKNRKDAMVQPVEVKIQVQESPASEVPERPKPRTRHGIVCVCGSACVRVDKTRDLSRKYPAFMVRGSRRIRRYCICDDCGKRFTSEVELTERKI